MKAVLFDLGGTLHHYHREEVFRTILKEKGIEVRASEVLRAYDVTDPIFARLTAELPQEVMWPGMLVEQLDLMMLNEMGIREDCEKLASYIRQDWDRVDRQLPQNVVRTAYPDAVRCLSREKTWLENGNSIQHSIGRTSKKRAFEAIGLVKFFPILVSSGSVGVSKQI